MHSDFMTLSECFLDGGVVGVFVGNEVCSLDVATVWILTVSVEDFLVQFNVVVINSIIKSDGDHHWNILDWQVSGNGGTIFRTETIRQDTSLQVAWWSSVWIVFSIYIQKIEKICILKLKNRKMCR